MTRKTIRNVELMTRMQETACLVEGRCYRGVFSKVGEARYLFEEAVVTSRCEMRNPKLFEGRHISLVHRQNGRYQVHMRTILPVNQEEAQQLAFQVYDELVTAFKQIH